MALMSLAFAPIGPILESHLHPQPWYSGLCFIGPMFMEHFWLSGRLAGGMATYSSRREVNMRSRRKGMELSLQ